MTNSPGRKLDGASHGGHQRRFNEVVAGFQPQVTRAGAGAIVAEVVEGDAEDGKLYLNVEPIGEASLVVEKQGLGSIPAVEEIGDAVAVQEVTLARVLEHETDLKPVLSPGERPGAGLGRSGHSTQHESDGRNARRVPKAIGLQVARQSGVAGYGEAAVDGE